MRKLLCLLLLGAGVAHAAGPRFVTGMPFFTGQAGVPIGWKGPQLLYSTDPGDLSANVNHAAADALVAAAAGVWNVPVASISVVQGAPLAEHVSSQNVYFDTTGLHLPADVSTPNTLAIIYDTDGSVTDTLLGSGASNPSGCRQNAVTESVDSFNPAGYIAHALIVINGRCTGTAAAAQLQLRYQLMRAFGRVLGLAWSQTNDNVFTGTPAPTPVQEQNWPIMHPLDIICGPYTYQCLPNPFTLRADDIAGLVAVYPIDGSQPIPPGKQLSYANAQSLWGKLYFPTGEGMAGVNVLVRRMAYGSNTPESFFIGSAVTGAYARLASTSSFVAADTSAQGSFGAGDPGLLGQFLIPWFPLLGTGLDNRLTSTEPINPLYTGEYTLGPYPAGNVQPSGSPLAQTAFLQGAGEGYLISTIPDAAATCSNGTDGTPSAPMPVPSTGWWTGLTCAFGHVAYAGATVRANRTYTLEVAALDQAGIATMGKLMPVLASFADADDPPYTPPSIAATVTAFNGLASGTTTLHASTGNAAALRLGIADQRGDGRPDFNYQARLFYADSLAPAQLAAQGGTLSISGLGFRTGNAVSVNGVAVPVTSWTANTIVVNVPSAASLGVAGSNAVDVTVSDRSTGATSTMSAVLAFSPAGTQPASMRLIGAPNGTQYAGDPTTAPLTVQLLGSDGTTPVPNVPVTFSGPVTFAPCCTVLTDSRGLATAHPTPTMAGTTTLQATAGTLQQTATFTVIPQATRLNVFSTPESPLRVGVPSSSAFAVQSIGPDGVHSLPFRAVTFTVTAGSATFDACSASPCTVVSNGSGETYIHVIPQAVGSVTVQARDGDLAQTVTVQALTSVDILNVLVAPPTQFYVSQGNRLFFQLFHADGTTPDGGEPLLITALNGVALDVCATPTCTLTTDGNGIVTFVVSAANPGTYTVQAAFGAVTQTVAFTVIAHQWQLKILSMPANGSRTGVVAAQPFQVQVVQEDGVTPAPIGGRSLILGGDTGAVSLTNCPSSACEIFTGPDATATAWIIPQQPGPLTLSAIYAPLATSASFTAAGSTRSMIIVSEPSAGGAPVGAQTNLAVEVISADGTTPLGGDPVSFTVVSGPFQFYGSFATYLSGTGGDGIAYGSGTATGYGPVVVQATDGFVSRLLSFTAGAPPHVMQVLSTPPSPSTTGTPAARPFTVQVFAADGATPLTGDPVTFTLTTGTATFAGCATAICTVATDLQGLASVQVTPGSTGVIGLLAADGSVTQAVLFTTVAPPDVLRLVSAPADGSYVGLPAGQPLAIQVLLADGITPTPGKTITLSATSATLACGSPCTLVSDATGNVATTVTPTTAGTIKLQAADGPATLSTTFNAIPRPDTLQLLSGPTGTIGTGYPATTPFSVQLLQGDGTPHAGQTITFSAAQGTVRFGACTTAPCSILTGADGTASPTITPLTAGPVTLLASIGTLSQSATFNAATLPDILHITSAPADGGYTGIPAAKPFTLQVLLANNASPAIARPITLSVPAGSATFAACNGPTCTFSTDANGLLSTQITPGSIGSITLQASDGTSTASTSFTTVARPDNLTIRTAPSGAQPTGIPTPFTVQLLQADSTPDPTRPILFTATNATLTGCAFPCLTAQDGTATMNATPSNAGQVVLTATYGTLTQTVTFNAYQRPDTLQLLSAPVNGTTVNSPAATPFHVQALTPDGTPAADRTVTLSVTSGTATLSACSGLSTCALITNAAGQVSTTVTPTSAGSITLLAAEAQATISATFNATASSYTLTALQPTQYIAEGATADVFLSAHATQNSLPAADQSIAWTGTSASQPTTSTDKYGDTTNIASAGPLAAGSSATATACAWSTTCATFNVTAVSAADVIPTITSGQNQSALSFLPVTITITDTAGHPTLGVPISISQTVTAYAGPCPAQGRCPAAPLLASLITEATSDPTGRYTFLPLTVEGQPTETRIAVSAGTSGFTTTILTRQP